MLTINKKYQSPTGRLILIAALLAGLLRCALTVTPARAASFTVTKTADTADGTCDADCSLREAITAANNAAGADTTTVPAATYTLTIPGASEGTVWFDKAKLVN